MQVRAMHSLPDYVRLLEADAGEHKLLLNDLLIGVTNFFRDREAFETLERDILPAIFRDRKPSDEVRAWVAGCATGEEAYSLAMLLADQAAQMAHPPAYQVFASDIDEHAIAVARAGMYPTSIVTDVAPARLRGCASISRATRTATRSARRCATASCSPCTTCCAIRRSRAST